jgi:hypothetical protein
VIAGADERGRNRDLSGLPDNPVTHPATARKGLLRYVTKLFSLRSKAKCRAPEIRVANPPSCVGSFTDRIFDLDLCLIHARFGLGAASCSHDSLNASELSGATRDVRDGHVGKLPRPGAARKHSPAGKELVAIFEDIHIVGGGGPIVVDVIGNATRPCFLHLHSVDDGALVGKVR